MFVWWINLPPSWNTNRSCARKQQLCISTILGMQDYHMISTPCKCRFFDLGCTIDLMWLLHKVQMASLHSSRFIMQQRRFTLRALLMCHQSTKFVNVSSNRMNHIILFLVVMLQNVTQSHGLGWILWNDVSSGNGTRQVRRFINGRGKLYWLQ
jgi:hypothetical protein